MYTIMNECILKTGGRGLYDRRMILSTTAYLNVCPQTHEDERKYLRNTRLS